MAHRLLCASKTKDVLMGYKDTDRAIAHLEKLREDIRDEIKKRIEQRDKYSIQLTIALSAVIAIAFSKTKDENFVYSGILIVVPLISIYFNVLIMYSYTIHRTAARYLREKIEQELANLCGTPIDMEWENYYSEEAKKIPGIMPFQKNNDTLSGFLFVMPITPVNIIIN